MLGMSKYYYSDAIFQLEINLHKIRRELISMLEFCEQTDCENCYPLKCKCTGDIKTVSEKSTNESDGREDKEKKAYGSSTKPRNEESPAPSTPERDTVNEDIEEWMAASNRAEDVFTTVANTKKSLVTIESVRPADISRKDLQKSNIFNNPNFTNNANTVDTFFKYFQNTSDTNKMVYLQKLTLASNKRIKNDNHFSYIP